MTPLQKTSDLYNHLILLEFINSNVRWKATNITSSIGKPIAE